MKRSTAIATGILAALIAATPVSAGPITGTTSPLDPPVTGTTMDVEVSVDSVIPVVPYEYAIQNERSLPNKGGRSIQCDANVDWTYEVAEIPHAVMPIYLQSIPVGSKCKVFLMRNNTQVKGSVTAYTVVAAP